MKIKKLTYHKSGLPKQNISAKINEIIDKINELEKRIKTLKNERQTKK